jgi:hypothetical protein
MGAVGGGMKPPPDPGLYDGQGETLKDIAVNLVRDVAWECAPNSPGEPAFTRVDRGRTGRCTLEGR